MTRRFVPLVLVLVWLLVPAAPSSANETAPPTAVVEEGPFGDAVVMDGVLAPEGAVELELEPERYSGSFEVVEAARAGPVEPGQVLARFDREPYDRQLAAAALELELARTRFEKDEVKFGRQVDELRLGLDEAKRTHRIAKEKLQRFETVERQLRIDEAEQGMAWSRDNLSNQLEELQQLEKMYKEDDLTEETEEIVLRRARRSYERSKRSFEFRKLRHKWFLEQSLPRDHESLRLSLHKYELRLDKATKSLELQKREAELEHTKHTRAFSERKRSYEELKADRELFILRAPSSGGYALPGAFKGGRWSGLGENGVRWKPGDKVKGGAVLYTVFAPTRLGVHTSIGQEDLADVRPGRPCTVTCSVAPGLLFPAEVESVSDYGEGGKYEVRVALRAGNPWFRAGQKVKATVMGAAAPVALNIPASCVVGKGRKAHVLVLTKAGPEKRTVKLGERIGDRVGIADGLAAGEHVLLDPPKTGGDQDEKKKADGGEDPKKGAQDEAEDDTAKKPDQPGGDRGAEKEDDTDAPKLTLVGTWRGKIEGPEPFPPEGLPGALVVTRGDDGELEGTFELAGQAIPLKEIDFDPEDGTVEFEAGTDMGSVTGEGRLDGDRLEGTWATSGGLEGTFVFEREEDV